MFNALVLEQHDKKTLANVTALDESALPYGNVTVNIDFSSLNYKDGLAITGKGKIVRQFPMVPGIDFAGTVADSQHPDYQPEIKWCLLAGASVKDTGAEWPKKRALTVTGSFPYQADSLNSKQ